MEPRSDGITKGSISAGKEAFELDMTEYVDVSRFEDYLSEEWRKIVTSILFALLFFIYVMG